MPPAGLGRDAIRTTARSAAHAFIAAEGRGEPFEQDVMDALLLPVAHAVSRERDRRDASPRLRPIPREPGVAIASATSMNPRRAARQDRRPLLVR